MHGLKIYLADGNFKGTVTMSSDSSKFTAVRVSRKTMHDFDTELDGTGIYFLLVGNDAVYVGQTGLDTLQKRILNKHSADIDKSWHTVLAFKFADFTITANELLFIENAMCEYVHTHYPKCLTTTPAKENCNSKYRKDHYHLGAAQIHTCENYIKDIEHYISMFPGSIFNGFVQPKPPIDAHGPKKQKTLFQFINSKQGVKATAEIEIHTGNTKPRETRVKAGATLSKDVSPNFKSSDSIKQERMELEKEGKIIDRVLQVDVPFKSQSAALAFLNGTSLSGNKCWKTVDGNIPLGDLLK